MERGEVHRHVGTERVHHPAGHPVDLVVGVVLARDHQGGQLEPDVGLVGEVLEGVEHRLQRTAAHPLVEVLAERLEVDVGGVHVVEELAPRLGEDLARGDGDRRDTELVAGARHVDRVLEEDHGVVVGEGDAAAAERRGGPGDRCGGARRRPGCPSCATSTCPSSGRTCRPGCSRRCRTTAPAVPG